MTAAEFTQFQNNLINELRGALQQAQTANQALNQQILSNQAPQNFGPPLTARQQQALDRQRAELAILSSPEYSSPNFSAADIAASVGTFTGASSSTNSLTSEMIRGIAATPVTCTLTQSHFLTEPVASRLTAAATSFPSLGRSMA